MLFFLHRSKAARVPPSYHTLNPGIAQQGGHVNGDRVAMYIGYGLAECTMVGEGRWSRPGVPKKLQRVYANYNYGDNSSPVIPVRRMR